MVAATHVAAPPSSKLYLLILAANFPCGHLYNKKIPLQPKKLQTDNRQSTNKVSKVSVNVPSRGQTGALMCMCCEPSHHGSTLEGGHMVWVILQMTGLHHQLPEGVGVFSPVTTGNSSELMPDLEMCYQKYPFIFTKYQSLHMKTKCFI